MLGYCPSFCFLGIILMNMYIPEYFIYICSFLRHRNSTLLLSDKAVPLLCFFHSIILLIWCCHSSPCTSRPQPTMGRSSWFCFNVPDFTAVRNGTSYAEFTDKWPSETFLPLLQHKLQPSGVPLCQRQPNWTNQRAEWPARLLGDLSCKCTHL